MLTLSNIKSNMPFDKETGKYAGRKSSRNGVPNKTDRRKVISDLLDDYFPNGFKKNFSKLSADTQAKVMLKMLEFDTAKKRAVQFDDRNNINEDKLTERQKKIYAKLNFYELEDDQCGAIYSILQKKVSYVKMFGKKLPFYEI